MSHAVRRVFLPAVVAGSLLVIAMRGGSYDDVVRRETFFVAWWVIGLAAAAGLLPRARPSRAALITVAGFVALAVWAAVGAIWSDSVGLSLHESVRTLGFAGMLLLLVWGVGPREWRRAAAGLAIAAVLITCAAMLSRLTPLTGALEESGYVTRRLNYPFNYWNAVGVWAAMTVGLALSWSAHAARVAVRAAALAGVCVAVPVAYLTYSRSGAVGVVLATFIVVALSRHRWLAALNVLLAGAAAVATILTIRSHTEIAEGTGTAGAAAVAIVLVAGIAFCALGTVIAAKVGLDHVRMPERATRVALGVAAVIALVAVITMGPAAADSAWDSFRHKQETTQAADPAARLTDLSGERRTLWDVALSAFRRQPLGGEGAGTYQFAWNRDPRWSHHVIDAHSLYFETLAETGLVGMVLLLITLGTALISTFRVSLRRRDARSVGAGAGCAAALVVFCVTAGVDWMWESTAVAVLAFGCAGAGLAAGGREAEGRRAGQRAAGVVLALVALAFTAPALIGVSEVRASQRAVRENDPEGAVAAATTAVSLEPWNAANYRQRALVLERRGFLDAAATDMTRAIAREPVNYELWLIRARIEAERGRGAAAVRDAERARSLNPRNPIFAPPAGG